MANSKPSKIPEIPVDEEDVEFLYQIEAAEARALSLSSPPSSTKRRRLSVEDPNNNNSSNDNAVIVEEGSYTAALKGSKSLKWQKQLQQQQEQQQQKYAVKNASDSPAFVVGGGGGGGGSGGGCFKCGKEGHWARECPQVTSSLGSVGPTSAAVGVEKACACGLGNCLLLTANTERNRGRKFFRCPVRQENGGCGFFEWFDETSGNRTSAEGEKAWNNGEQQQSYPRPANQAASNFTKQWNNFDNSAPNSTYGQKFDTNENKGYSMGSDSSCFICGQQGHWAKDCPTTSSNVTAGARGNSSSGACYKCGESGHWARDCSQGRSTMIRNW